MVLGAGGGVGLAAVDIAVADGRQGDCRGIGPREARGVPCSAARRRCIDYDREDLRTRLKEITGEGGAQVVVDPVGGRYSEPALRGLGRGGQFVTLGYAAGIDSRDSAEPGAAEGNHRAGHGDPDLHGRSPRRDRPATTPSCAQLFADGRLRPYLGARFPLEQAATALRYVADRKAIGKVVIDVA